MNKLWRFYLPGHFACLPFTVGYLLWCFLVYRARSWGFRNGVVVAIGGVKKDGSTRIFGQPGAQTVGAAQCYASSREELRDDLHVHENVHIVEAFVCSMIGLAVTLIVVLVAAPDLWWFALLFGGSFGVAGYSIAYIVIFLRWYLTDQGDAEQPGWQDDYHRNNFELWAYAIQKRWLTFDQKTREKAWL